MYAKNIKPSVKHEVQTEWSAKHDDRIDRPRRAQICELCAKRTMRMQILIIIIVQMKYRDCSRNEMQGKRSCFAQLGVQGSHEVRNVRKNRSWWKMGERALTGGRCYTGEQSRTKNQHFALSQACKLAWIYRSGCLHLRPPLHRVDDACSVH